MARYTRTPITQLSANESAAVQQINKNLEDIQTAIQDTVSRSGQSPTQMTADLDMNGKRLINVPAPLTDNDLVRRVDVVSDIATVQSLVNTASTAAGQAIAAAEGVQEAIADAHVGIVADDLILGENSKIRIVANNIDEISACVSDISDIKAVGDNISNINAVADNTSDIDTVVTNISDINDCADNMSSITGASTQAVNAAASAQSAAASAEAAAQSAAISNPPPLLSHQWSDHLLNDIRYLRADTFSWQDGTVYTNAYNHLVADYQGGTSQTETVGSYTITYVLATDGHKITTDETTVANIYNESGVAWYYILDTTNQRFKLPRTKYGFVGLRDTVGKYVPESLPNIKGSVLWTAGAQGKLDVTSATGCFYPTSVLTSAYPSPTGSSSIRPGFDLNASLSSSTYQDNAPVQQRATQMYLYFYVGQFSQSATEQTAGLNSELFNGKLDLNAANLSTAGKSLISGLGMPSDTYEDLTYTVSSFYTAPANGYIVIDKIVGTGSYLFCASYPNDYTGAVGNVSAALQTFSRYKTTGNNDALSGIISVKKGDKFGFEGNINGSTRLCRFVYAEGDV